MQITSLAALLFIATQASFASEESCLKQLGGGGRSDIECYIESSQQLDIENHKLAARIIKESEHPGIARSQLRKLTRAAQDYETATCSAQKLAALNWAREKPDGMTEHRFDDLIYRECVFRMKQGLNSNLNEILRLDSK